MKKNKAFFFFTIMLSFAFLLSACSTIRIRALKPTDSLLSEDLVQGIIDVNDAAKVEKLGLKGDLRVHAIGGKWFKSAFVSPNKKIGKYTVVYSHSDSGEKPRQDQYYEVEIDFPEKGSYLLNKRVVDGVAKYVVFRDIGETKVLGFDVSAVKKIKARNKFIKTWTVDERKAYTGTIEK